MTFYYGEEALSRHLRGCHRGCEAKHRHVKPKRAIAWFYAGELRSFRDQDTGHVYRRSFDTKERMSEVTERCLSAGIEPGPYSRIWRKVAPRILMGPLCRSRASVPVAWIESYPGHDWTLNGAPLTFEDCNEYDMNAAYGWALGSAPLPMPSSARITKRRTKGASMVTVKRPDADRLSPPCYRYHHGEYFASLDDVDRYSFRGASVVQYVTFEHALDLRPFVDRLYDTLPLWIVKNVLRAAWGTYMASAKLEQVQFVGGRAVKRHALAGLSFPELASTVIGRVNARIHDVVCHERADAVRVYVDSVTLAGRKIKTGTNPGDWRLQARYPTMTIGSNPGIVYAGPSMVKHSGITARAAAAMPPPQGALPGM